MKSLFSFTVLSAAGLCAVAVLNPAYADSIRYGDNVSDIAAERGADKDWHVTLGAGAFYQPEYEGGDEYEVMPLPFFNIRYKDRVELSPQGLDVNVLRRNGFKAGVGVGANFGREEDDADPLRGLGDIDPTAEGRVFVGYQTKPFDAKLTFSHDLLGEHEGYTIDAEVGTRYPLKFGERMIMMRPSISTTYASEDYMDTFFGIDAGQSARSGLAEYDSDAGFKDVSAGLMAAYKIDENWSLNLLTRYSYLLEEASDSPIVEDENQFSAGLFIGYTF